MHNVFFNGFKFGLILQAAVGPVSVFIFQTAAASGILSAWGAVLGVTLADLICVAAAIWGVGTLLDKSRTGKMYFKYFGAAVLWIFGAAAILGAFGLNIIPGFNISAEHTANSAFIYCFILAISSPLTIVFWAGIFSSKLTEDNMSRRDVHLYALGAVFSTLVCMSLVCAAGTLTSSFLPNAVIKAMNIVVGAVLIFFGIRTLRKQQ
ncbi:MAG: LysE family transporter [Synergistaceae bacterium]